MLLNVKKGWLGLAVAGFVALLVSLHLFVVDSPSLRLSIGLPLPQARAGGSEAALRARGVEDEEEVAVAPSELKADVAELIRGMVKDKDVVETAGTVWNHLVAAVARKDALPEVKKSLLDASLAWKELGGWVQQQQQQQRQDAETNATTACPYSVSLLAAADANKGRLELEIPCGLVLDSSITLVGVPRGALGDFRMDLVGHGVPGQPSPPLVLHYNVRLRGDALTSDPVIVQNTWTQAGDWADEQRCPTPDLGAANKTVDGLLLCSAQVGANLTSSGRWHKVTSSSSRRDRWFPYAEGHPFAATMWIGWQGFHMTVDGKHITSFEYRQNLEPWMVSQVRIDGSLQLSSVIVNGLPTSESLDALPDLEILKAPALPRDSEAELFIGIVSTANNFERRMAVRRSWMQYEAVRSGKVIVRFFVGLHQTQQVNRELWKERKSYGDVQLLPFVDYYNLITFKTLSICIFATQVVKAHYIMKTDDDTFVRVDQVLSAVRNSNHNGSLLYGLIESDSKPDRDVRSKWYVKPEEWPHPRYPPWAHGPGYVFSSDIAKFVVQKNKELKLKLFKLEDVAMGAWIEEYAAQGKGVSYVNDEHFHSDGCKVGYVIAHYQNPRQMVCLWHQLSQGSGPVCC